jgi:hypothetical protein
MPLDYRTAAHSTSRLSLGHRGGGAPRPSGYQKGLLPLSVAGLPLSSAMRAPPARYP